MIATAGLAQTNWPRVALLLASGIAAAGHIGKVPGALPVLTSDLHLDLGTAALMTAIYSLVSATCGLFFGLGARRFGAVSLVVGGLVLASLASLGGSQAVSVGPLLISRVIEGLGFVMVSVGAPALIMAATRPEDRRLALGLWGTYVPAGTSLMMLVAAGTLAPLGWRGVWGLAAALTAGMALAVWLGVRDTGQAALTGAAPMDWRASMRDALAPPSRRLALSFAVYGAQYLAVTAFVPLMLVETAGVSVATAGVLGAGVAAANILGNVVAGWVGVRGWSVMRAVTVGALGMGLGAIPIFAVGAPVWLKVASAMIFCAMGGLIPGTLLGAAPRVARTPAAAAAVVGLMIQGAAIGQLVGPPLLARAVKGAGSWQGAWMFTIAASMVLLALASRLKPLATETAVRPAPRSTR